MINVKNPKKQMDVNKFEEHVKLIQKYREKGKYHFERKEYDIAYNAFKKCNKYCFLFNISIL